MDEYKNVGEVLQNLLLIGDEVKGIAKDMKKFWNNPKYKQINLDDIRSFDEGLEMLEYSSQEIKDCIKRINQLKKIEEKK